MNALLAELVRETWAMEPRALEAFLQTAGRWPADAQPPAQAGLETLGQQFAGVTSTALNPVSARDGMGPFDEAPRRSRLAVAEGMASIGISGVLLKRVPNLARWFGVEATSYGEIQADLAQAMGDDNVKTIRLHIESPGGSISGLKETADAIYQAATRKDIKSEIQDIGASAAYWLASQADEITANPNAVVGSIGVVTSFLDSSKRAADEGFKVHIVASGPHKGIGIPGAPITDQQLANVKEMIDAVAKGFMADVARGLGIDLKSMSPEVLADWTSGRIWRAEEAVAAGVIHGIRAGSSTERTSSGGPAAADTPQGEVDSMANEQEKAAAEDKIRGDAAVAERKRLADLEAAFPGEEKFVMEQYKAGATVERASVAFVAVQRERLAAKDRELAEAKTKPATAAKPAGVPPVVSAGDPASNVEDGNIMDLAKAMVEDGKAASFAEAMSRLSRGKNGQRNSPLFDKHMQACVDEAPAHQARKAAAGVS